MTLIRTIYDVVYRCDGGVIEYGLAFSVYNGIADGKKYTYTGQKSKKCQSKKYPPSYYLQNFCYTSPDGDEDMLKLLVIKYGPIAVAINSVGTGLDLYSSGVFYDPTCSSDPKNADHAVVNFHAETLSRFNFHAETI